MRLDLIRLFWTLQARSDLINIWRSINGVNFMFEKQTGYKQPDSLFEATGIALRSNYGWKITTHIPFQFEDTFKNTQWRKAKFWPKSRQFDWDRFEK